ncbi:hypothetical protein MN608_11860 [Microdochium nivale]|nr:hypothetical protein MN608_11860 [Microdochium nivale]
MIKLEATRWLAIPLEGFFLPAVQFESELARVVKRYYDSLYPETVLSNMHMAHLGIGHVICEIVRCVGLQSTFEKDKLKYRRPRPRLALRTVVTSTAQTPPGLVWETSNFEPAWYALQR